MSLKSHHALNSVTTPATAKETILQLLSNLANPKEIDLYLKRFVNAGENRFAIIKVGGAILDNDLDNLCASLAFLQQIGLVPIIVHGAGPQLNLQLEKAGVESHFIDGQRVTSPQVLGFARKVFIEQNLKLSNRLQSLGVKTAPFNSGVFIATPSSDEQLGLVGEVGQVVLDAISESVKVGAIPILSSIAETKSGQILNINADVATNQLAVAINPYKIIFLTETGGILDQNDKIISSINLVTDYRKLIEQPWLNGGMKLKLKQIAQILSQLSATTSVSITTPSHLAKELFTHKGSGTLIRRGESIMIHDDIETIKAGKLKSLLESGFDKALDADYFVNTAISKAYITYCYRAAAIVTNETEVPYLDKFVVAEEAKGEGLGKTLWAKLCQQTPALFWRASTDNPINDFYFNHSHGCYKSKQWNVFWRGLDDFQQIQSCVEFALNKQSTLCLQQNSSKN